MRFAFMAVLVAGSLATVGPIARAQDAGPVTEGPDPTRLDVERLPPEAIEITRDLYNHGFFVEGYIGGRGFQGGVGILSNPGLFANVGFGYEIFNWLMAKVAVEGSVHGTDAPAPPSPDVFELLGVLGELKLQLNFTSRFGVWFAGEAGIVVATGDILPTYGLDQAEDISLMYGGSMGIDWHMRNRHHSIGLMGGARLYPSLEGYDGSRAIGIHSALYVRYVF